MFETFANLVPDTPRKYIDFGALIGVGSTVRVLVPVFTFRE